MSAIVGKQRKIVTQRSRSYENVQVANKISVFSQPTSLAGEYATYGVIQRNDFHPNEKFSQHARFTF